MAAFLPTSGSTSLRQVPGGPPASLRLRVHPPGGRPRELVTGVEKVTIGSGPRCSVRLRTSGVQPLHCLITCTAGTATVRRWSAGTRLNGEDFDDAALSVGDRLQVGPVDVEILEINAKQMKPRGRAEATRPDATPSRNEISIPKPAAGVDGPIGGGASTAAEDVFRQLRAANEINRRRSRRLLAALREDRVARHELELRLEELEQQFARLSEDDRNADVVEPMEVTDRQTHDDTTAERDHHEVAAVAEVAEQVVAQIEEVAPPESPPPAEASDAPEAVVPDPRLTAAAPAAAVTDSKPTDEAYSALLADRIDRIEQLERQLGIMTEPAEADEPALDDPPGVAIEEPAAALDEPADDSAPEANESTDQVVDDVREESSADEPPEHPGTESQPMDWEPAEETAPTLAVTAPESEVTAPPPTDAVPAAESFSSDAASFWGFAGEACQVDAELLGPVARARHAGHRTAQPADEPELPVELPASEESASPSVNDDDTPDQPDQTSEYPVQAPEETAQALEQPAVAGEPTELAERFEATAATELPGAEPPAIPGLSDSAWAHLRELAIWKEVSETSADDTHDEPINDPAEWPSAASGVPAETIDNSVPADWQPDVDQPSEESAPNIASGTAAEAAPASEQEAVAARVEDVGAVPPEESAPIAHEVEAVGPTVDDLPPEDVASLASETGEPPSQGPLPSQPAEGNPLLMAGPTTEPSVEANDAALADPPPTVAPSRPAETAPVGEQSPVEDQAAPPATTSFIDRYAHMFEDDGNAEASVDAATAGEPDSPALTTPTNEPQGSLSAGLEDGGARGEEDSIDDYMAQLMQRIRGDSAAAPAQPVWTPPPKDAPGSSLSADQRSAAPGAGNSPQEDHAQDDLEPMTLEEMKSSRPPPEQSTDMGALRELANQTARSAIGVHSSRMHRENALSKLLVAGAAVASGMYLLATAPDLLSWQFGGACFAVLAALYWGSMIMRSFSEAARVAAAAERAMESRDPARSQLPIDHPPAPKPD